MPFRYDILLNRAHTRIFNLAKKIRSSKPELCTDAEIKDVLEAQDLFGSVETGVSEAVMQDAG